MSKHKKPIFWTTTVLCMALALFAAISEVASSDGVKCGECPYVAIICETRIADPYKNCQYDSQCSGDLKCCPTAPCGLYECTKPAPVEIKFGNCPGPFFCPMETNETVRVNICNNDGMCPGTEKCCMGCFGNSCMEIASNPV